MEYKRWTDLTKEEQDQFGGSCGPGNGFVGKLVPELYFNACCRQHDYYYSRGGDIFMKIEADLMFFAHMVKSVNTRFNKWYKKIFPVFIAWAYFVAVSIGGLFLWSFRK